MWFLTDVSRSMGIDRTSCSLSWCSRTRAAFLRDARSVRESAANVRALDSSVGSVDSQDDSEEESESMEEESVDVVECSERNVG